jgi:hypothetical protein
MFSCNPFGLSSPSKLDTSDVEAVARKEFEQYFTKCGDSYFANRIPWGLVQFKDVRFDVKQLDLTDADKLNSIEWKGAANVNCDLTRLYDNMAHKWSDWSSKNAFLNPGGNGGRHAGLGGLSEGRLNKIDCAAVPK